MFRALLWLFVVLPVGIVLVALAVANKQPVALILDPFSPDSPALAFEAPLFLVVMAALIAGLIVGGVAAWLGQGRWRKTARRRSEEAERLRREADRLNRQLDAATQARLPQPASAD